MLNLLNQIKKMQFAKGLSAILLSLALASCSDTDGPPEDLVGTVAMGEATQGTVFVVDSNGVQTKDLIGVNGVFKVDVRKKSAPFMLKYVASNGLDPELFAYAAEENITVNITPSTNLAMFIANGEADPAILYNNWSSTFVNITPAIIDDAQAIVNANLSTQYTAFSLDPLTYDFFGTSFFASNLGIDALYDAMTVDLSGGVISVSIIGLGEIPFDTGIDITDFDIGGISVATSGAYTLITNVSVDGALSADLLLSINLPSSSVPTTVDTQIVEDTFVSFYGSVGDIVINSVTVTGNVIETIAVVDTTITTDSGDVSYIATYTYTQNL